MLAKPLLTAALLATCVTTALAQPTPPTPPDPSVPAPVEPTAPDPVPPTPPAPPTPPMVVLPVAEVAVEPAKPEPDKKPDKKWYDKIGVRGYSQIRYNRLPSGKVNDDLINTQGDRSIGKNGGFLIRRARLILSGDVHDHVAIYLQPDFASSAGTQGGVAVLRDWYADIFLDKKKEFRFRVGQSKVPYGFENLQSSQNRLPLDRNDALNSAVRDERDLGVFFYWSPPKFRALFKKLVDDNLKGSGDYGIVGVGMYNGQTANQPADEGAPHVIGRVSVPLELGSQIIEVGGGAYYGKYTTTITQPTMGTRIEVEGATTDAPNPALRDTRAFGTFVLYPKPFGIQAEYTAGYGPQQGILTPTRIDSAYLHGGYATLSYKIDNPYGMHSIIPFARGTYYSGGKKFFANAPHYLVKEVEVGVEVQVAKALEVVLAYDMVRRTNDTTLVDEYGHVTRVQVQFNY